MKAIISHQNTDFDALASMVACSKLYPDATMFFTGKHKEEVKKFITLYKNVLNISQAGKLNLDEFDEVFIVDVNSAKRIGKFKELLDNEDVAVTIYDHHIIGEHSIQRGQQIIKPYGACTTILLEEIIQREINITAFEATLFALGIYTDTNCLTFSHTTYQDAEAVAYLLKKGANLAVIGEVMRDTLAPEQDELFSIVINNLETIDVNGYQIIISTLVQEDFIGELSSMTEKLIEIKKCDGVFLVVKMEDRCYIVGRSIVDEIDLPVVLSRFGGGGHRKAASASIKNGVPEEVKTLLLQSLKEHTKPKITAKEIMSYPVKTVFEDMTVEEVNKIMLRYGHTGMPVIKDDELIGIISRTDIDKAIIHGLGHAPVKGFMTRNIKNISTNTSITEINTLMSKYNIGRLPVMEEGRIVGIVTRTDLLKVLYGNNHPNWYKKVFDQEDVAKEMNCINLLHQLPTEIYRILDMTGKVADTLGKRAYVVGGFVRDLLLKTPNWDIDIVIEGDGILFAKELSQQLKGETTLYQQFGTAVITLQDGKTIDIVSARREYYEYPAALPKVEQSTIWSDLFRRDFTINCLAIQLNKATEGQLIDYFGGLVDLENKKIRVLYNLSFIEDPTRIFRALRFASRFDFEIEVETSYFMEQAIKDKMIEKLSDDRIREEVLQVLKEKSISESLLLFKKYGIFKILHDDLTIDEDIFNKIATIDDAIVKFQPYFEETINKIQLIVMHLLSNFPIDKLEEVLNKFIGSKIMAKQVKTTLLLKSQLYQQLNKEDLDKFSLYQLLKSLKREEVVFYYNDCNDSYIKHYLLFYVLKLKDIEIEITGNDLMTLGIKPGPIFKIILDEVLKAKVQGLIYNKEDEINYVKEKLEDFRSEKNVSI